MRLSECCNSALLLAGQYNYRTKVFHNFVDVGCSENCPDECVCKINVKLGAGWHALFCCVLLVLACLASYPGVPATASTVCGTTKVGTLQKTIGCFNH